MKTMQATAHQESILVMKAFGDVCQKPGHIIHVNFCFPLRQQRSRPVYMSAYCIQDYVVF